MLLLVLFEFVSGLFTPNFIVCVFFPFIYIFLSFFECSFSNSELNQSKVSAYSCFSLLMVLCMPSLLLIDRIGLNFALLHILN